MTSSPMFASMSDLLPRGLAFLAAVVSLVSPAMQESPSDGGKEKPAESPSRLQPAKVIPLRPADREFLPAALELLETPPSPIVLYLIWTICLLVVVALTWSWFGRLDIEAVASGKIQPSGQSKVVQPVDLGKVVSIDVKNGTVVKQGDVLLKLDPTETSADSEALLREVESADAEVARRHAAVDIASSADLRIVPIQFEAGTSETVRRREQGVLEADLAKLAAGEDTLKAQLAQAQSTVQRLTESMAERATMVALDKELVGMRERLETTGSSSRAQVIEARQRYETDLVTQVTEQGQIRESHNSAEATQRKITELVSQFLSDQMEKLEDAARKRDHTVGELVKAQSKNARTRLTAPVDGVVQQLAVTSIGQVVTSGQALMTIVPADAPLEVTAMVLNKDIGFVHEGQHAVVKVEAFPFTRYGTIEGTITRVSADAVDMKSAPNLSEAAATVKPQGASPGSESERPQLAFPATVALSQYSFDIDGKKVNLTPGMSVTVEIRTGSRRAIDYILSPLREVVSQSAHER